MSTSYALSLSEAAKLIATGELSPVQLLDSVLARIEATEPSIDAYVGLALPDALEQARIAEHEITHGRRIGPLHGVPIALKDVFDFRGEVTGAGLGTAGARPAPRNAVVVDAMRDAGAVIVGRARAHEAALGVETPPTSNPWNPARIPGGSSGGSAAAVAIGSATAALGTDTGGSVRIPATMCGVVGFKPTYGLISTSGVVPNSWSLDTVGTLTRSVADSALVVAALAADHLQSRRRPLRRSTLNEYHPSPVSAPPETVGIPTNYFFDRLDDPVRNGIANLVSRLSAAGVATREVVMPSVQEYVTTVRTIQLPEIYSYHADALARHPENFSSRLRETLARGAELLAASYVAACRSRQRIIAEWDELFESVDLLLVPGLPCGASRKGVTVVEWPDAETETIWEAFSRLTLPANLTKFPAIALPAGLDDDGLPYGIQLIGRPFDEASVLHMADYCEQLTGWSGEAVLSSSPRR